MKWYLIQCKSGQEDRAILHLGNQGFECYKPEINVEKVKKGKISTATEAMFPGYAFIKLDKVTSNWSVVRSTRGVLRLVAFGREPMPVDEAVIGKLREDDGNGRVPRPIFKKGESLTVADGPFAQLEAVFQESDGEKRAVVLLNLISKWHKIALPLKQLRA